MLRYAGAWAAGLAVLYLLMSIAAFVVHALDKAAAGAGNRRISENTLLTLSLLCGWPGALLAQRMLRHKTSKRSFRTSFRLMIAGNLLALILLLTLIWRIATLAVAG